MRYGLNSYVLHYSLVSMCSEAVSTELIISLFHAAHKIEVIIISHILYTSWVTEINAWDAHYLLVESQSSTYAIKICDGQFTIALDIM